MKWKPGVLLGPSIATKQRPKDIVRAQLSGTNWICYSKLRAGFRLLVLDTNETTAHVVAYKGSKNGIVSIDIAAMDPYVKVEDRRINANTDVSKAVALARLERFSTDNKTIEKSICWSGIIDRKGFNIVNRLSLNAIKIGGP